MRGWIGLSVGVLLATLGAVAAEEEPGFVSLFNGKDLTGWVIMGNPEGWKVVDGTIHSDGGKGGNWIRTEKEYGNFIFRLEWMLSTVGNSGVLIRTGGSSGRPGFEVQLLAPWTPPRDDLHCTGSIYGHVPAHPRPDETPNRWRSLEIACERKRITVKVDGQVCCQANMDEVPSLKNAALRGYVGMQDSHTGPGEWVKFRHLRIKDLDEDPAFVIAGLKSQEAEIYRQALEAAVRLGPAIVGPLFELLGEDNPASIRVAEGSLFAVAAATSAPAAPPARRAAVSEALTGQLQGHAPARARSCAARLLGLVGGGAEAVPGLAAALRDEATHEAARAALQLIPGPEATQALLDALADAPAGQRPGLIQALGARRDAGAVYPLSDLARTGDEATRVAALLALGQIGNAAAAPALETGREDDSAAVRQAAVDATLALAAAQQEHNPTLARQLYRRALEAAPTGVSRGAALIGLQATGDPDFLPQLFAALREEEARTIAFQLLQAQGGETVVPAVLAELQQATGWERALLLRWAYERAGPELQAELLAAARGEDEPAQVAALELLARQPDPAQAMLFLNAAKSGSEAVKIAALDGYLKLADLHREKGEGGTALRMYLRTLDLAPRDEERRRALAGIATLANPVARYRVEALLAGSSVREEAAGTLLVLADALVAAGQKQEALDAYTKIVQSDPPLRAASQAGAKLRELGVTRDFARGLGFITHWWLLGPFPNPDQSAYEKAFFPEKEINLTKEYEAEGQKLRWKPHHETRSVHGIVELLETVAHANNVAAYAYAEVTSDQAQDVLIKLGSDDGFVLWLNGQRLAGTASLRALTVDENVVPAHLKAGVNRILLKVLNGSSRWAFALRITDPRGRPLRLSERGAERGKQ